MKTKTQSRIFNRWAMAVTAIVSITAMSGQRPLGDDLATISGTVQFNNTNPVIQGFLRDSFLLEPNGHTVHARGDSGCAETATTTLLSGAPGDIGFSYELDVVASPAGVRYSVGGGGCGAAWNLMPETLSNPVTTPGSVTPVNVAGCIQLLRLRFVDEFGVSKPASSVRYNVTSAGGPISYRLLFSTAELLVPLPSHVATDIQVSYETGSDVTADTANFVRNIHIAPGCDVVTDLTELLPSNPPRGQIAGRLDMADFGAIPNREFFRGSSDPSLDLYAWSSIVVAYKPPQDGALERLRFDRVTRLPDGPEGSSGPFILPNLPAGSYSVYGRMQFGNGGTFNLFQTPLLQNLAVTAGMTNSLSDTLVIHPGRLTGEIELRGPEAGITHLFLGAPEDALLERHTSVTAHGSPNAGFPPFGGVGTGKIAGSFPNPNRFAGSYSLMLGALNGAASQWDLDVLTVRFDSDRSGFPGGPYLKGAFRLHRQEHDLVNLSPGSTVTKDLRLCLSEVVVQLNFGTNLVFNPRIDMSGAYEGPNRPWDAEHVNYTVTSVPESGAFEGTPVARGAAESVATVYLYLPEGNYLLYPHIKTVNAGGGEDELQLPPLALPNVGPCDRICISPCLQLQLTNVPACLGEPGARIEGYVTSRCTNNVSRIEWNTPGEATNIVCQNCGFDPGFSFVLPTNGPCTDNTFTITAYDDSGLCASITRTIPRDTTPPAIQCPTNLVVQCAGPVQFPVSVSDNCDPAPILICTPASGSIFSPGTSIVFCTARDACGNSNFCTFTVTMLNNCPSNSCISILSCPSDIRLPCQSFEGTQVNWDFVATNFCVASNLVTWCVPPSFSTFAPGTHQVTCYASNTLGGELKTCQFNVTIFVPRPQLHGLLQRVAAGPLTPGLALSWMQGCGEFSLQTTPQLNPTGPGGGPIWSPLSDLPFASWTRPNPTNNAIEQFVAPNIPLPPVDPQNTASPGSHSSLFGRDRNRGGFFLATLGTFHGFGGRSSLLQLQSDCWRTNADCPVEQPACVASK